MVGMKRIAVVVGCALGLLALSLSAASAACTNGSSSCTGDCDGCGDVAVNEIIILVNIVLGNAGVSSCLYGVPGGAPVTISQIVSAVNIALGSASCIRTADTPTPTLTSTPTPTGTLGSGPLGTRHFLLNASKSEFVVYVGNFPLLSGKIRGQNASGAVEPAFLDLEAGAPDPTTGVATINVTDTSEYFFVSSSFLVLCLKPEKPVTAAGVVACRGGLPFGFGTSQNHKLGQVGVDGFTAEQCTTMNGQVESPNQICATGMVGHLCRANADCDSSAGAGDGVCGLGAATCTEPSAKAGTACQADADCDTDETAGDGVCGMPGPLGIEGICKGSFEAQTLPGDTGPGGVVIAPNPQFQLNGLPVRLSMQPPGSLPCTDPGPSASIGFAVTSGISRATIFNANGVDDDTRTTEIEGQNFSCSDWPNVNGPGRLVLAAPQLDIPMVGDITTTFSFDGSPPKPTPTPTTRP